MWRWYGGVFECATRYVKERKTLGRVIGEWDGWLERREGYLAHLTLRFRGTERSLIENVITGRCGEGGW